MSKKRIRKDTVLLPETVVTPQGNYTLFSGEESLLPTLDYFRQAEIDKDRVNAVSKMLLLNAPIDPHNPSMSYPSKTMGVLGMSDDTRNFIDAYTIDGDISDGAPKQLKELSMFYSPDNLKKYLKGFLSVTAPVTIVAKTDE